MQEKRGGAGRGMHDVNARSALRMRGFQRRARGERLILRCAAEVSRQSQELEERM